MPDLLITTEAKGSVDFEIRQRVQQASMGVVVNTPEWAAGEDKPEERMVTVEVVLIWKDTVAMGTKGTRQPYTDMLALIEAWLCGWPAAEIWTPMRFQNTAVLSAGEPAGVVVAATRFMTSTIVKITE
jgi:hypothetical protein